MFHLQNLFPPFPGLGVVSCCFGWISLPIMWIPHYADGVTLEWTVSRPAPPVSWDRDVLFFPSSANVDVGYKFKCLIMEMMGTSAQTKVESVGRLEPPHLTPNLALDLTVYSLGPLWLQLLQGLLDLIWVELFCSSPSLVFWTPNTKWLKMRPYLEKELMWYN